MRSKKILFVLLPVVFIACQQTSNQHNGSDSTSQNVTSDTTTARADINKLFDQFHQGVKGKNANVIFSMLDDNAWILGTDPSEMWTKKQFEDYMNQQFKDTTSLRYDVNTREIRIATNGNSAMVVEQFLMPAFGNLNVRTVNHVIKEGNTWKLDFHSWNIVLKNDDIGKVSAALSK